MTRRTLVLPLFGVFVLTAAVGSVPVGAEEAPAAPPTDASPAAPAPSDPAAPRAARDPFRPFNLSRSPRRKPETPLEQYDLGSLTLVAVIWNMSDPRAMVEDDSGLGYTVRIGTPIGRNDGTVKKIEPNRIIVEEEFVDFYGEKKKKEVTLELPAEEEGEKRP
jgi:type IV pilus assembly protein PilP